MSGEANVYGKLRHCYECVRKKTDFVPRAAIVLGSGLGDYAEAIRVEAELPYPRCLGMRGNLFSAMWIRFLWPA